MYLEAIKYKYPHSIENIDFEIRNDGKGEYISKWKLSDPQPTLVQIEEYYLNYLKENKLIELDKACESTILARFKVTLNGIEYEFSYDMNSQSRFNGTGVLFLGNKITEVPWTAYVNGERVRLVLNKTDFDVVSMAALYHQNSNIIKYNQLLLDVENATSIPEVNLIKWV